MIRQSTVMLRLDRGIHGPQAWIPRSSRGMTNIRLWLWLAWNMRLN